MPVKTILLHLTDEDHLDGRLWTAADLARRHGAFVDVIHVPNPAVAPPIIGIAGDTNAAMAEATVISQHRAAETERASRVALKDLRWSWSSIEGEHLEILADESLTADLAIIAIPDPESDAARGLAHLPERLPLAAPCPVLILPTAFPAGKPVGERIVVAWKPMREAAMAVRGALPLLCEAASVTILTLDTQSGPREPDSTRDVVTFLERHGVSVRVENRKTRQGDVGEAMIAAVGDLEGDLLVMGAYGHSRFREMMLGGATRGVLRDVEVPVLMAH